MAGIKTKAAALSRAHKLVRKVAGAASKEEGNADATQLGHLVAKWNLLSTQADAETDDQPGAGEAGPSVIDNIREVVKDPKVRAAGAAIVDLVGDWMSRPPRSPGRG